MKDFPITPSKYVSTKHLDNNTLMNLQFIANKGFCGLSASNGYTTPA